jgi:hypothetical protein
MSIFRSFGVLVRTHKRGANLVTARPPSSARMRRLIVSPESIAFLRDRARTETILASKTNCGPAEWSHSQLARLYLERCTEITGNVGQIVGSVIETDLLDQTASSSGAFLENGKGDSPDRPEPFQPPRRLQS